MQYSEFKDLASSEKITLATLDASKRLMGWSVHSGSVYKIPCSFLVVQSLEDSGATYAEADSLASISSGQYFLDRDAQILYVQTTASDNPNSRFLVITARFFFSSSPVALAYDLNTGFDVFWEPMIKTTSQFGVEIDTINQTSEAIEGSGSLTLFNDQDFWPKNFDKLYFENKPCFIYSYHRDLAPSEAKLIYKGVVDQKSYTTEAIQFSLKDTLAQLRAPLALGTIADLGARTTSDVARARQRLVLGRVFGHVPINTDEVLDGYPISGALSVSYNSNIVTGSGTSFLAQLSPDDRIILDGDEFTVATVNTDTSLTITENYPNAGGLSGVSAFVIPDQPKRWMNRTWHLAGHPLREPVTATENGSSIIRLIVEDASDIYAGDWIYVGEIGSGELVQVLSTTGSKIVNLVTSLATVPLIGTKVTRPAVQNVRIDDVSLTYYRDYTLDAETATLTLRSTAESNSAPIRHLNVSLSFTIGSRVVNGSNLKNTIKPGYMVGVIGNSVFFEVLSVDSDTQLTLRTAATFNSTTTGRYKALILDPKESHLSMDILGKTEDGATGGKLLKTAPSIVKALLVDIGLGGDILEQSFMDAEGEAHMHLGMVVPSGYSDSETPIYRDIINAVNKSVFGSLIQTGDFKLTYNILKPTKPTDALRLDESDILDLKFDSTGENIVKTATVEYQRREFDYLTGEESIQTKQKTSDIANLIAKTGREKTFTTYLVEENDAALIANRWAFILELGAGRATITTKLQGIEAEVGSVVQITHRKFFERVGLSTSSRLFLVEAAKKSGTGVQLEVVDLSSSFSRVACYNTLSNSYSSANDEEKLYGGFWTDEYGLIDNDPDSFGTNLLW